MFKKSAPVLLLGSVMLAVSCASMAQDKGGGSKGGTSVVPTVAGSGKVTTGSLTQRYLTLAGSEANAKSLVNGLQTGSVVTLELMVKGEGMCTVQVANCTSPSTPITQMLCRTNPGGTHPEQRPCPDQLQQVTFSPPTGNMGLGNVDIALALTEARFTQQNVSLPNITAIHSTLMNADKGILQLRAKGMGWGEIAKSLELELK